MYGNKKLLTMVACILIFALAFVPTHRVGAVVPAIPAAVYYAIAATGVAGGIYAANRDSLDYVVSDYWNKTSDYVKKQWSYTTAAGWMGGKMIVDGALSQTVIDYLRDKYHTGVNRVKDSIDKPSNFVGWTDCIRERVTLYIPGGTILDIMRATMMAGKSIYCQTATGLMSLNMGSFAFIIVKIPTAR